MNESRPSSPGQIAGRAPPAEPDADTQLSAPDLVAPDFAVTLIPAPDDPDVTHTEGPRLPTEHDSPRLTRGALVGRFLVLDRLGAGGMGVVYAAYDPELDRKVAIKLVPKDTTKGVDASAGATRLLREAQSMARLSHPNVVAVYDVGSISVGVYIAMEHIDGCTLTTWLESKPRTWREILRVFEAAGRGIEAAHRAGLIHRDFKPDNVMIDNDGRVRVLDFGLARGAKTPDSDSGERVESSGGWSPASHLELKLTMPGTVMGTPRYMAPEQHLGKTADERSDIYSFCVALWEAVYRARPFSGHSLAELSSRVISGEVDEPPKGVRVPRWLRGVLRRGMARDSASRFPDMTALLTALGRDRQRRTGWIAAGIVLAATATVGGLAAYRLARAQVCDDADAVLEDVWDDPRKDAVEASFEREGKTYTAASWRNVERTLDEYAESLVAMRREACEASRVHGTQSDDVLGRRMACLDRRLRRLSVLTGALAEGGTTTVLRAVEAAHGLPDIALCADVERLTSGVPPPDDPAVRAEVDDIRLELERLEALGAAGKLDGLTTDVDAVLERARASEYRPIVAEALLLRGNFLANFGKAEPARTDLLEALDLAERDGHDHVIVRASTLLVFVEGAQLNHFDLAELHGHRAQAVLERLGSDPSMQVDLWSRQGTLQLIQNNDAEAVVLLQRAVDLARESGESGPELVTVLNPLASALMGSDRYDEAAIVVEESRKIVDSEMGPDHPNAGVVLATLGRLRDGQKRHEEALEFHRRARDVFVASLGPQHGNVGATANAIGLALASLGRDEEAVAAYREALAIIEHTNGPEHIAAATALMNIAYQQLRQGQGAEAIEALRRVIAIREPKFGRDSEKVALAKDLLGDAYAAKGDREQARTTYREAIATFEKLGSRGQQAYGHIGLAKLLLAERRHEDAILEAEGALALMGEDTGAADRGEARFTLAKALQGAGRDRERMRELLTQAERDFGEAGASRARDLAEVKRWAAAHR